SVEALAILDDGRQQLKVAALPPFAFQPPRQFVARLRLDCYLALGTKLCAEAGEKQPDEVINLRNRRHRAFAAAATGALLDADRRRNAGNEVHVRPRKLLDELPGIEVHRIEKSPLSLGKQQV